MKVALLGSRGIPAKYGGNETFVEEVSKRLLMHGFEVYVTCESDKFYVDSYKGIIRVHIPSVKSNIITVPVINDLIATVYLSTRYGPEIEIFYYVAPDGSVSAILPRLLGKTTLVNPDGIEWKRPIRRGLFWPFYLRLLSPLMTIVQWSFEYLSIKVPHIVVADSLEIKEHLEKTYNAKNVVYIPYGARELISSELSKDDEISILNKYGVSPRGYYLTVARIVAENNIHVEIEGFKKAKSEKKLVIVGNFNKKDPYTKYLFRLKGDNKNILLLDPIYDKEVLGVLRKNCFAYIHAYEVGGTNPSLLEQMLFKRPILAYDVPFNKGVLQEGGIYFKDAEDLANKMEMLERGEFDLKLIKKTQIRRIKRQYNWEKVAKEYERLFRSLIRRTQR
jgi:glycosyltransferase involved in cell wall biosynthesis